MAVTVKLKKAVHVKGKETTTVVLDLDKLTGNDLIAAESEARALKAGEASVFASMKFQAVVAAKAIGCPADDLFELSARDCRGKGHQLPGRRSFRVRREGLQPHCYIDAKFSRGVVDKTTGIRPIKKLAFQMAMATYTPVEFYLSIPLPLLIEYAEIVKEIGRDRQ